MNGFARATESPVARIGNHGPQPCTSMRQRAWNKSVSCCFSDLHQHGCPTRSRSTQMNHQKAMPAMAAGRGVFDCARIKVASLLHLAVTTAFQLIDRCNLVAVPLF